jgi:hypothetical protein
MRCLGGGLPGKCSAVWPELSANYASKPPAPGRAGGKMKIMLRPADATLFPLIADFCNKIGTRLPTRDVRASVSYRG